MILANEDLWLHPEKVTMIVVTTNGVITKAGKLVMGRGCAHDLLLKVPGIDAEAAEVIEESGMCTKIVAHEYNGAQTRVSFTNYGFLPIRNPIKTGKVGIGIFQTKEVWWEEAKPWLIELSTNMLSQFSEQHPGIHFRLAFPGIGNGKLPKELVLPIIRNLPDTVTVCYREE